MQRVGHLFEKIVSYDHLLLAFYRAKKGTKTEEAKKFEFHLEEELLQLKEELLAGSYRPQKYSYFYIKEPKERRVSVAKFRDRVVHHAVVMVLEPIFEKRFIYDSYANRRGKGLHRGVKRLQKMIRTKDEYYLKADIQKFFDNIDHSILLSQLKKKIKDKKALSLFSKIIRNGDGEGKGLPIGNLTSQFFANVYLSAFDHFVKEELQAKNYVRYMDDFVIVEKDVEKLKEMKRNIQEYLRENLDLTLKKKATFLNKVDNGISFCGLRIFASLIRIKRENLGYSIVKIKQRLWEYQRGKVDEEELRQSLASIFAHWEHYNTYVLRKKLLEELEL